MNQIDINDSYYAEDELHDECGVFGVYDFDGNDVSSTIYYGLFALQHRGQESCGIAVSDTEGPKGKVMSHKDMGLVNEVFNPEVLEKLKGNIGVGHVRYSTAGSSSRENAQPLVLNYVKGTLGMAHNGNLLNAVELREELSYTGAIFQTTIDSEVIAYLIARERLNVGTVEEAVKNAMTKIKGAYSLVVMSPRKLIGARDPFGFKPLCIGKRDNAYFLSSETCALDTVGAEFVRDVEPGEVVTITKEGIKSDKSLCQKNTAKCIFEYIYFARPDSKIDGMGVYESRINAGRILAKTHPVDADLVVGVPESGNPAALGFSMESGIPYGNAFIKNNYVGRTFIKPKQEQRESSVKVKLNVLKEAVAGKRVVMIDDSIVRGTTSARIVSLLKAAGAKEVHVRISSPAFLHPCYFGTDIPSEDQLIASGHSVEEICEIIGADSLGYLEVDKLSEMICGGTGFCDACFTGNYPIEPPTIDIRGEMG
ncbi:MAG: amidophosphoribosyltransferase [Lachnospira sp.]|nr:amidophosphoribosyltransferase [Lachnospira sp.]MDD5829130.1 amidophosphoribosyltransferase [Lachnospira sp.]